MIKRVIKSLKPSTTTDWIMFLGMVVSIVSIVMYLNQIKFGEYGMTIAIALISSGLVFEFTTKFQNN